MALITCPECRRSVSDRAAACPQCGYPINPAASEPVLRALLLRRANLAIGFGLVNLALGTVASFVRLQYATFALIGIVLLAVGMYRRAKLNS
jgi:hypothetical protein